MVCAANCLGIATLIDRSGNRQVLADRHPGNVRQDRQQFGEGGAVAVYTAIGLLERDRHIERQRIGPRKGSRQPSLEHQCAFLLERAAQTDIALDVQHAAAADGCPCRDPARRPEILIADIPHGQRVDLADNLSRRRNQDRLAGYALLDPVLDPRIPAAPVLERRFNRFRRDFLCAGMAGNVSRLRDQILDPLDLRRYFRPVGRPARRFAEQPGDGGIGAGNALPAGSRDPADQPAIGIEILRRRGHIRIDIGLYLEIALELGIG